MPGWTFWNALSGHPANMRPNTSNTPFLAVAAPAAAANDRVGAGSQTNMKSAMIAIITLAATKSSSCAGRGQQRQQQQEQQKDVGKACVWDLLS
jgi:hypothetical protein